jgi:hypothetical protein
MILGPTEILADGEIYVAMEMVHGFGKDCAHAHYERDYIRHKLHCHYDSVHIHGITL